MGGINPTCIQNVSFFNDIPNLIIKVHKHTAGAISDQALDDCIFFCLDLSFFLYHNEY